MGRPPGIPMEGRYGVGVETTIIRVPISWKEKTPRLIKQLPELVKEWKSRSKDTRDWTQANKLIEELEKILED